jgi:hypothetical protein
LDAAETVCGDPVRSCTTCLKEEVSVCTKVVGYGFTFRLGFVSWGMGERALGIADGFELGFGFESFFSTSIAKKEGGRLWVSNSEVLSLSPPLDVRGGYSLFGV